jgi:hypothetical protein
MADPYELTNLIGMGSHNEVAVELKSKLIKRMIMAVESTPKIDKAPPQYYGQREVLR